MIGLHCFFNVIAFGGLLVYNIQNISSLCECEHADLQRNQLVFVFPLHNQRCVHTFCTNECKEFPRMKEIKIQKKERERQTKREREVGGGNEEEEREEDRGREMDR